MIRRILLFIAAAAFAVGVSWKIQAQSSVPLHSSAGRCGPRGVRAVLRFVPWGEPR